MAYKWLPLSLFVDWQIQNRLGQKMSVVAETLNQTSLDDDQDNGRWNSLPSKMTFD